jgi:Protein of unknown function (Gmx_para_CXXCG)
MNFVTLEISRRRKFVEGSSDNDWESVVCARNPGHQRVGRRLTDLSLNILSWNAVDFSRTMLSDIVITNHAFSVLSEAGLTGFEVRPTKITSLPSGVRVAKLPKLWEFVVTGKGGPAHKASGIVELGRCEVCGLVRYSAYEHGIVVDESTYDGSDFFTVLEYPKYVLASPRAREVIEKSRLTNVEFMDSTKHVWSKNVIRPEWNG